MSCLDEMNNNTVHEILLLIILNIETNNDFSANRNKNILIHF